MGGKLTGETGGFTTDDMTLIGEEARARSLTPIQAAIVYNLTDYPQGPEPVRFSNEGAALSLDGATGDWEVSGEAMRWNPELIDGGNSNA